MTLIEHIERIAMVTGLTQATVSAFMESAPNKTLMIICATTWIVCEVIRCFG